MKPQLAILLWLISQVGGSAPGERATEPPSLAKTNFIENFDAEALAPFVRERKYVVILFSDSKRRSQSVSTLFFRLSSEFESRQVFFVEVDALQQTPETLQAHHVDVFPDLRLYVYGIPRRFTLEVTRKALAAWLTQIIEADVVKVVEAAQVHPVDRHFVVHVAEPLVQENRAHFTVLAKLLSPITLYTGLSDPDIRTLTTASEAQATFPTICAVREHDGLVIPVGEELGLADKTRLVTQNEFAEDMECNDAALRLVTEHKIPVLAYFDRGGQFRHWDAVSSVARPFREYLLALRVDLSAENKCCQFFREFLAVDQPENLRILDMHGRVKRYEFIGAFSEANLRVFLDNFVSGNLRPYRLNERLKPGDNHRGIPLANAKTFSRITRHLQNYALFYVFGHDDADFEDHVGQLRVVQSVFRENKRFSIHLLDHLRNDLDGYYHPKTPFVVGILPTGKVSHFAGPIRAEGLIKWVLKLAPFLEIREPAVELFDEL